MKLLIAREKKLVDAAARELAFRRINWRSETRHRVRRMLEKVVALAQEQSYPFRLHVNEFEQPNEGLIQILASANPTGVVNRKEHFDAERGSWDHDTLVVESGASLVVSQSVTGHIHFTVHLYRSDRVMPRRREVLLFTPLDPRAVSVRRIERSLRLFFLFVRASSVHTFSDGLSVIERVRLMWIRFRDLRSRYTLNKSLVSLKNEWAKAIFAALLALVVAILMATSVTAQKAGPNNSSKPTPLRGAA